MNLGKKLIIPVAGALALVGIGSVLADTVTQAVTGGSLSGSIAAKSLTSKAYSHTSQTSTGTLTLTADDSRGTGAGWNVTVQTSNFVGSGTNTIAGSNLSLASAATPVSTAGQAVDTTNGPMVPATSPVGTLETPKKVIQANAGFGQGTYTQDLGISLSIPGQTKADTYVGTLTVTAANAP